MVYNVVDVCTLSYRYMHCIVYGPRSLAGNCRHHHSTYLEFEVHGLGRRKGGVLYM